MSRQFGAIGSRNTEKSGNQSRQDVENEQNGNEVHALSLEFVAKPSEARRAHTAVPVAINSTLQGVTGFAGCLVMSSDQEARLMKVITFWKGAEGARRCAQNRRWIGKLLEPFLDGGLKCRTYVMHMPAQSCFSPAAFTFAKEEARLPVERKAEEVYVS